MHRLAVLFLVAGWAVSGCPVAADTVPHRHFGAADGLPSETITALAQGPDGRLWVGTESGLVVYDGHEMRRVPLPDSIGTTYISALAVMPDGAVWVAPSRGEAVKVRRRGVVRALSLGQRVVQRMLRRGDTVLFVTRRAVWRIPPGAAAPRRQPFRYPIQPSALGATPGTGAGVFNADLGPDGTLWVVDGHLGPGRLRPDGSVDFVGAPPKPPGDLWYTLRFASDGTGVVLQGEQLHRLDPATGRLVRVVDGLGSPTYLSVQGTRAYVTRGRTLLRYDTAAGRLRSPLGPALGLPAQVPTRVLRGREGGLWIGTREGLLHLRAPAVRHVESVAGESLFNVFQLSRRGASLWAHTDGAGLVGLRPRRRETPNGLTRWSRPVYAHDGRVHALSVETGGWYRRGANGWAHLGDTEGALEGVVAPDGRGYFLHEDGLYRHAPDGERPVKLSGWSEENTHKHDLALLPSGDLLHRSGAALLRRGPGAGTLLDTLAVLGGGADATLTRLVVDEHRRAWATHLHGGLQRVDLKTGRRRTILSEYRMQGVTVAGDSLVLAGARKQGVYLVDARTLELRRHLTRADGLRSNLATAAHLTPDSLYVGHENGVTRLPHDGLFRPHASPAAVLTGLQVNFEDRALPADSALAATDRTVGFSYTAPSLTHADQVEFEVRLPPRSSAWEATDRRFIRYTDLTPGTYQFEVRARLEGRPPGPTASYSFTIPPRFYETTWFRLLVVLGVVALVGVGVRWRLRRLRQRQKELEAAVQTRTAELAAEKRKTEQQAERLAELDEAKNRFFAHISHEFRTPLSLILTPLRDALREASGEQAALRRDQLRGMIGSAERLQRLIDQLLDLATIEAGRMELDRQDGDLGATVRRVVDAFGPRAEAASIDLHVDAGPDRIATRYDEDRVETILFNLLDNALKFTPEGGAVTVRVRASDATGAVEPPGDAEAAVGTARIEVVDTGPGIAPEVQDQIFDRFERVSGPDAREDEGTGLGLALTGALTELHGGTVAVDSTPGEGSTFVVHLPIVPGAEPSADGDAPAEPRGRLPAPDAPRPGPDTAGQGARAPHDGGEAGVADATVLVVEDNAQLRAYLHEQLSQDWRVRTAADGTEAWTAVQAEAPDLVVSDVMMPAPDGVELCRRIKTDAALRTVPVLLLTARAGQEATLEGLQAGADDYVSKPFDIAELRQRIANHLAARAHYRTRYRDEVRLVPLETVAEDESVPFVERVTAVIDENLSDPDFTVGRLADAVALSRRQLTRRLKDAVGEPPGAFLRRYRLEWARRRLEGGADTVAEVAYAVGFRSPSAFAQSFREAHGHPPSHHLRDAPEA
jgi:signal transduction histidine kinase/DNA-binding response OmpR family regulator/streptogramin lyase